MMYLKSYKIFENSENSGLGFEVDDDFYDYSREYKSKMNHRYVVRVKWMEGDGDHYPYTEVSTNDQEQFEDYLRFYFEIANFEKNKQTARMGGHQAMDNVGYFGSFQVEAENSQIFMDILTKYPSIWRGDGTGSPHNHYLYDLVHSNEYWYSSLEEIEVYVDNKRRRVIHPVAYRDNKITLPKVGDKISINTKFITVSYTDAYRVKVGDYQAPTAVELRDIYDISYQTNNEKHLDLDVTVLDIVDMESNEPNYDQYAVVFDLPNPDGEDLKAFIIRRGFA